MKDEKKLQIVWIIVLSLTAGLFLTEGLINILVDKAVFDGIIKLISALVLGISVFYVDPHLVAFERATGKRAVVFFAGFLLMVIGALSIHNIGLWALGYLLFMKGLFENRAWQKG